MELGLERKNVLVTDILVNSAGAARRAQGGKVPSPVHLAGGAANAALMLASAGLANAYALLLRAVLAGRLGLRLHA